MKKTKNLHFANLYLALGAIFASLLLNQLYLRFRVIPVAITSNTEDKWNTQHESQSVNKSLIYPQLIIKKIDLALPIFQAKIKDGKWETTNRGLSHAVETAALGKEGNTVIYGHNWPNMLKRLPDLNPGDMITIELSETEALRYTVTYTATIKPDDTSLTRNTSDSRLTLYTCTGLLDQDRYVVVAHLN